MRLTKKGILTGPLSGERAPNPVARPRRSDFLLAYWHCQLAEIAEDYTVGDLVSLLRGVDDIENVSPLLGCDEAVGDGSDQGTDDRSDPE